ncbi:MAG: NYN domain-containing protein [Hyphomonas sp.]
MPRVRSVLLVDFDNIYGATSEDVVTALPQWLLWLEDGAFSPNNRRRRFIDKRVYWNLQFDQYRPEFEAAGFVAYNCRALAKRKISAGKSSADIVLTMDAIEIAQTQDKIDEIILLTTDSDFVPVVNRLQSSERRVVTCGKETDPTYELFSQYADAVVHIGALKAAFSYQRAKRKWYRLRSPPPEIAPLSLMRERRTPLMSRVRVALDASEVAADGPPPAHVRAAKMVRELAERMPDQRLSKSRIVKTLAVMPEFTPVYHGGVKPWLGHKNYAAMMRGLAAIQPGLEVTTVARKQVEVVWREPAVEPPPPYVEEPVSAPANGSLRLTDETAEAEPRAEEPKETKERESEPATASTGNGARP